MNKRGRPQIHKNQKRLSISFSDDAWAILKLAKAGKRSEMVSLLVASYANHLDSTFFAKKKLK